jgi:hypothetical protein
MDKIIEIGKTYPFSDEDIRKTCDYKVNVLTYTDLASMRDLDECFVVSGDLNKDSPMFGQDVGACILLYMTKHNFGHWVCFFRVPGVDDTIEFFDSYGLMPDDELQFVPAHFRKESEQDVPHLTWLFRNSKYKKFIYNKDKLQRVFADVNTCGRWSACRVGNMAIPLRNFQRMFIKQKFDPDWYVTAITLMI